MTVMILGDTPKTRKWEQRLKVKAAEEDEE